MRILKEREEEYKCPKCNRPLDFECNEMKEKNIPLWKCIIALESRTYKTGNGWFGCEKCNKEYLIEDYCKVRNLKVSRPGGKDE